MWNNCKQIPKSHKFDFKNVSSMWLTKHLLFDFKDFFIVFVYCVVGPVNSGY